MEHFDDLFGAASAPGADGWIHHVRVCFGWEQVAAVLRQWVERAELVESSVGVRRINGLWELRVSLAPSQVQKLARLDALRHQEAGAGEDDIERARRLAR